MSNELALKEQTALVSFIERAATDQNVDIEKLERIIQLKNSEEEKTAKAAYHSAMAQCQSKMPEISENGEIVVNGQVRSRYAKFEDIVKATKPLLSEYGFSFSSKSQFTDKNVIVSGIVSHAGGHSEETQTVLPFDNSGSKNNVQAVGSSLSYARRYLFCMLFNITTGGEDDDGNAASNDVITVEQAAKLKERLAATESDVKKFCGYFKCASVDALPATLYAKADAHLTKKESENANS